MRKRILEKLTVGGFGLFVLGVIIFVLSGAGSFSAGGFIAGILFGYLILMGGIVLQTVAWVGALIAQAKRQQWGWFVCTILFGFPCLWLYLLIVPETPEPERATSGAFSYPPMQRDIQLASPPRLLPMVSQANHINYTNLQCHPNQRRQSGLSSRKNSRCGLAISLACCIYQYTECKGIHPNLLEDICKT